MPEESSKGGSRFLDERGKPIKSPDYLLESTKSVFHCDERISLDIEISIPLSQSIDVLNGKETHTYLLNRYMITDYVSVENKTQQRGGNILTKSILHDRLSTGFVDLVQNQPTSHISQLLNGTIQELDLRMVLRYKEYTVENNELHFTIERKTIELEEDEMYDLLLSFNKRV